MRSFERRTYTAVPRGVPALCIQQKFGRLDMDRTQDAQNRRSIHWVFPCGAIFSIKA